jgi:hypothetical protein
MAIASLSAHVCVSSSMRNALGASLRAGSAIASLKLTRGTTMPKRLNNSPRRSASASRMLGRNSSSGVAK